MPIFMRAPLYWRRRAATHGRAARRVISMANLFGDESRRNPYSVYAQLRGAAVHHDPGSGLWMLLGYDEVLGALHDPEAWSSRAAASGGQPLDWLIFQDPPRHTALRALILRAFTPRAVAALEPRIRTLSRELLDPVIANGEMDLCADYSIPLPLLVIAELIGIPTAERPRFRRWSEVILRLSDTVAAAGPEAERAVSAFRLASGEMRTYLADLLEARRAAPRDDLLSRLVAAELDGARLSPDEILAFFQLLLVAGSETTTNLISNAILCFADHPAELARVREDPALLPSAIEEVLRYRTPIQAVFRQTRREVTVGGRAIPPGTLVLVVIGAANRDPRRFDDADRFDVARDPNPHLAFGHGIHFCLGAALARLEARIALGDLLAQLKSFELARSDWEPRRAFHVHGPSSLPIRFDRA
jgi:cytochrome P450